MKIRPTLKEKNANDFLRHRKSRGITLIAMVMTIIILIILSVITINAVVGEKGIINKAQTITAKYDEISAKEKLEITLSDLFVEKQINEEYNETTFFNTYMSKQNFIVEDDVVIVDNYAFRVDRATLKIVKSMGENIHINNTNNNNIYKVGTYETVKVSASAGYAANAKDKNTIKIDIKEVYKDYNNLTIDNFLLVDTISRIFVSKDINGLCLLRLFFGEDKL